MRQVASPVVARGRPPAMDDDGDFYRTHVRTVHQYIGSRVGFQVGEELTAQTFVEAWAQRSTFDPSMGTPAAWLLGIATNLLRRYVRDESRRDRAHRALAAQRQFAGLADSLQEEVLDAMIVAERTGAVRRTIGRIDSADREILTMAIQPGITYQDMAERLGIPVGTVRSRLSRARRHLTAAVNAE